MNQLSDFEHTLHLNDNAKTYVLETAKWAKFLSIVGFVITGFIVIGALFAGSILAFLKESNSGHMGVPAAAITFVYLLLAAVYFLPCWYLYKAAVFLKSALATNNSTDLAAGLGKVNSYFKFMGILTLLVLGMYALILVFALVGGGIAALAL
jgi:hypothetical protein